MSRHKECNNYEKQQSQFEQGLSKFPFPLRTPQIQIMMVVNTAANVYKRFFFCQKSHILKPVVATKSVACPSKTTSMVYTFVSRPQHFHKIN